MDKKVKLEFKVKKNISKKIGEQTIKIKPFISIDEKKYILDLISTSINERIRANDDITSLILGIQADLDVLICSLCTNIDLEDLVYENLYNSNVLPIIKKSIENYEDVEKSCKDLLKIIQTSALLPDLSNLQDLNVEELLKGKSKEEIEEVIELVEDMNK